MDIQSPPYGSKLPVSAVSSRILGLAPEAIMPSYDPSPYKPSVNPTPYSIVKGSTLPPQPLPQYFPQLPIEGVPLKRTAGLA